MKTKALPKDQAISRTPWEDLKPQDQLFVLECIQEAMDMRVKAVIRQKAYSLFCVAISSGVEFSAELVWNKLHPRTQDHFNHSRPHHDEIDNEIDFLEELLEEEPPLEEDTALEEDTLLDEDNGLEEGDQFDGPQ